MNEFKLYHLIAGDTFKYKGNIYRVLKLNHFAYLCIDLSTNETVILSDEITVELL